MGMEQFTNKQRERGNAEIIFIALLTVSVIGIGAIGINMATGVSSDTKQQMDSPEFEISDNSDLGINYSSGPTLNNKDGTKAIKLYDGEQEFVLYNESGFVLNGAVPGDGNDQAILKPGEPLVTQETLKQLGIERGTTVEVILVRSNGKSEVVGEIYLPDPVTTGDNSKDKGPVDAEPADEPSAPSGPVLPGEPDFR